MVINYILLIVLVSTQVLGDICLKQGMRLFGEVTSFAPTVLVNLIGYLLTNVWIWLGVVTLVFSMGVYLVAISRLDISYVLPIHASSYVLNGVFAWLLLGEKVTTVRWIATLLISLGVLVVGWSEQYALRKRGAKAQNSSTRNVLNNSSSRLPLFILPIGLSLPKIWLGCLFLASADAAGDLLSALGMRQVGTMTSMTPLAILKWVSRVLSNSYMLLAIAGYTLAFLTFISLLSWADISLVRPATAMGYIMSLLGARYILQEQIHLGRLMGIVIIGCGIITLSFT